VPTFDVAALIYNGLRKVTPSNPQSRDKCEQGGRGQVTPPNVGAKQWAGSEEASPAGQRHNTPVGWAAYGVTPKAGFSNFTPLLTAWSTMSAT
jgi:hypothetical protein